jgi:hypothetical protein
MVGTGEGEMASKLKWRLPVPSTALLDEGPVFEIRGGREVALRFSYEAEDDERLTRAIVFRGVEAFKCTYYNARDASMLESYDTLVDRGPSAWLEDVSANLKRHRADARGLAHLLINFDDGPAYEVACRSFGVEEK